MGFSDGFLWGAATAAFQVEGAVNEGGRGTSVWDVFNHTPGKIKNGGTADIACDHYHRYREDIRMMKDLGLKAYRFSIAWPRVFPDGSGALNTPGLDFYDRRVDELLAAGITPCATLFHWDLPQKLHERGGWRNRETVERFADLADAAGRRLGDRVAFWMTLNEMNVVVDLGYRLGIHAPGEQLSRSEALEVIRGMLLGHGRAVQALRAVCQPGMKIGFAHQVTPRFPETESAEDVEAARRAVAVLPDEGGQRVHSQAVYMDPIVFGKYDEAVVRHYGDDLPSFSSDEMKIVSQPIDFIGLNIYAGRCVGADANGNPVGRPFTPEGYTHFKWPVVPQGLYWGPKLTYERYKLPVMITENGMSNADAVSDDGAVHDPQRIRFLNGYLKNLRKAAGEGVDLIGYMQWSLMDNFEWAEGYDQRFGIVYVDFETQKRTPKDSALWYRDVIASNGLKLGAGPA